MMPPKYMKSRDSNKKWMDDEMKECTFRPQTNPIPKNMLAAQEYIQTDIFQRLSGSLDAPRLDSEAESDYDCWSIAGQSKAQSQSASSDVRDKKFQEFLRRQEQKAQIREFRRRVSEQNAAPTHTPAISKKSKQIMEKKSENFFQRLEKQANKREQRMIQQRSLLAKV